MGLASLSNSPPPKTFVVLRRISLLPTVTESLSILSPPPFKSTTINMLHKKISGFLSTQKYQELGTESLLSPKERRYKDAEGDPENSLDDLPLRNHHSSQSLHICILTISLLLFALLSIALAIAYILKRTSDRDCGIQTSVFCEFQRFLHSFLHVSNILGVLLR